MKKRLIITSLFFGVLTWPSRAQDIEGIRSSAQSDAWQMALKEMCINGKAHISLRKDYDVWRNTIKQNAPLVQDDMLQRWIDSGVRQAQERYRGRKPPKGVCAFADESEARRKAAPTRVVGSNAGTVQVFRCKVDDVVVFTDSPYKSVPCRALDLAGYSYEPK